MSHFNCEHCGTAIIDTPDGYVTGCEHYPNTMNYDKEQKMESKYKKCTKRGKTKYGFYVACIKGLWRDEAMNTLLKGKK